MTYNFDEILDRSRERSKTWDPRGLKPGQLPMHGAETHFTCPYPVLDAVREVASWQVYGYPYFTDDFENSIAGWLHRRHGWKVDPAWVDFAGGIIPGMAFALQAMTKEGDQILINTPAYSPFRGVVQDNNRVLATSPLKISEEGVFFDWEDMERQFADPKTTAFILCDPHNPTGKCCTRKELERIAQLSEKYDVFVVSDEVHADFVFDGGKHICYSDVSAFAAGFSCVTVNPSKTFNVAGFRTGATIIPNEEIRQKMRVKNAAVKGISRNITGVAAFEACYDGRCDDYADQSKQYVESLRGELLDFFENTPIRMIKPEGTFVAWLDCRGLGFATQEELLSFFANECGLLMGDGREYDQKLGEGFVRIAYGFPRPQLHEAMERLSKAIKSR